MVKKIVMFKSILALVFFLFDCSLLAQDYTSINSGSWNSNVNWTNTSGWGSSKPKRNGNHWSGTVTVNHDLFTGGNYTLGSNTVTVSAGKSLDIGGNLTLNGGSSINVYGDLVVSGNIDLSGYLNIHAGGSVTVDGNLKVKSSNYLKVGDPGSSGLDYADLVVKGNLNSKSSGDSYIYTNARVAIGGNIQTLDNSGGSIFSIENGGQVYVDNDIIYSGGGDKIFNYNSVDPWGLYIKGTVTNSGGGSVTTSNKTDEEVMANTNVPFTNWVGGVLFIALPVEWGDFSAIISNNKVELNWRTMLEINNDYFLIQRSTNLKEWETIDEIAGNGNKQTPRIIKYLIIIHYLGQVIIELFKLILMGKQVSLFMFL